MQELLHNNEIFIKYKSLLYLKNNKSVMDKKLVINIIKLEESGFYINTDCDKLNTNEILIGFQCKINEDISNNILNIDLSVFYKDKSTETILMNGGVLSSYFISDLLNIVTKEKDRLKFNEPILPTLLSSTLGALRGILALKTKNTVFENFILPLIPVSHLLNDK